MLTEGKFDKDYWNKEIYPAIKSGVLKERMHLLPKQIRRFHIIMDTVIEDTDGTLFRCKTDCLMGQVNIRRFEQ